MEQCATPARHLFREEPILTQFAFSRAARVAGERRRRLARRTVSRDAASSGRVLRSAKSPGRGRPDGRNINRIARTLEQTGAIAGTAAHYCYVVARFVLLEDYRRDRKHVPLDEPRGVEISRARAHAAVESDERSALREERLDRLDRCLEQLRPDQRELAIEDYRDAKRQRIDRRRDLAGRLGISMNALGIRACRIRETLMRCVEGRQKARTTDLAGGDPIGISAHHSP